MRQSRAAIQLYRQMRTVACLTCVVAVPAHADRSTAMSRDPSRPEAILERFLSDTDLPLTSYRGWRTLEATTRGGKMHARLTAWTSLDPDSGFHYVVVEEEGSEVIRRRVLHAALEAERSMLAAGELNRGALTAVNYTFAGAAADDDGLVRIEIHPKRRDTMLVEGSILLTEHDGDLVRVEGRLIKRPSFWTRRVEVVREYERMNGVRVPVSMQSTAHVLVVGRSTFSMTYEYEAINGAPVTERGR
jgi:hypothetical protein